MGFKFVFESISQLKLIKEKGKSGLKSEDFFNIISKYDLFAANSVIISIFLLINLTNLLFFSLVLTLTILKTSNKLSSKLLDIILKELGLN